MKPKHYKWRLKGINTSCKTLAMTNDYLKIMTFDYSLLPIVICSFSLLDCSNVYIYNCTAGIMSNFWLWLQAIEHCSRAKQQPSDHNYIIIITELPLSTCSGNYLYKSFTYLLPIFYRFCVKVKPLDWNQKLRRWIKLPEPRHLGEMYVGMIPCCKQQKMNHTKGSKLSVIRSR